MQFIQNIQQRLLDNVLYKFSLIFCSLYVVLFFGNIQGIKILFYLFISMLLSIGIAGLGYVLNDVKDYKDDLQNNKPNLFNKFSEPESFGLVILFTTMAILPWLYLPFDKYSCYLLLIEFILFVSYSFPPFRLKEKGFYGVVTDALYAQVVPCLLAVYTFSKLGMNFKINFYFIALYAFWLFMAGIRNIINHQIDDYQNDKNTNTKTFVTRYGIIFSQKISMITILPFEIISILFLLYFLNLHFHITLIIYVLYVAFMFSVRIKLPENNLYSFINKRILNEFYEIHLPILLLIYFSYYNLFFIFVLLLNFMLFYPLYSKFLVGFYRKYF